MPNFRYQSSDYMGMRRGSFRNSSAPSQASCQASCEPARQPSCEAARQCETPKASSCEAARQCETPKASSCEASCREMPAPVCCNDKAGYDELKGMPVAMAYVPWQEWCSLYESDKGFHRGTIFEELDKPFLGTGGCCK